MTSPIRTIVVDLTPVLPGGANGGAKVFVLELLKRLSTMEPQTRFVLLTQESAHAELATLDAPNVRRLMVLRSAAREDPIRGRLLRVANRALPHLPNRVRSRVATAGYRLQSLLKRGRRSTLLRDLEADLLFCPFTAPTYHEPGIPTVSTLYDLQYKTYPEFFNATEVAHRNQTFLDTCRQASLIAAISDYSRESAIQHGGIDPRRIRTIHLRMAHRITREPAATGGAILQQLGLTSHRYIVFPANFWKHKNHEMMLTAFGIACQRGLAPDIRLVCTGAPGERQQFLQTAARRMGLGEHVLFPGYLPDDQLSALMAETAGMVFPSLYEGFGLPVIEAMAADIPVACSNTTSLPEVAAGAAILFNPRVPAEIAEAIVTLVTRRDVAARLIEAGRERAAEFADTDRMAREYWSLFEDALSARIEADSLSGLHTDGWAGPELQIQIASSRAPATIELDLMLPDWVPASRLTLKATRNGVALGRPVGVRRGARMTWSQPVGPGGQIIHLRLSPTFVPARTGHGQDQRELSSMIMRCDVIREGQPNRALMNGSSA